MKMTKKLKEITDWVNSYGSERLIYAYKNNYNFKKNYTKERAAKEHKDFILDYKSTIDLDKRANPSEEALKESSEINKRLKMPAVCKIKWFVNMYQEKDENENIPDHSCECIVIENYLGINQLIKFYEKNNEDDEHDMDF